MEFSVRDSQYRKIHEQICNAMKNIKQKRRERILLVKQIRICSPKISTLTYRLFSAEGNWESKDKERSLPRASLIWQKAETFEKQELPAIKPLSQDSFTAMKMTGSQHQESCIQTSLTKMTLISHQFPPYTYPSHNLSPLEAWNFFPLSCHIFKIYFSLLQMICKPSGLVISLVSISFLGMPTCQVKS